MKAVAMAALLAVLTATRAATQPSLLAPRPTRDVIERELSERRRTLVQYNAQGDRVLDLLIRHHLGVPNDVEALLMLDEMERATARGDAEAALEQAQRQVAVLVEDLARARDRVGAREREIAAQPPVKATGDWSPQLANAEPTPSVAHPNPAAEQTAPHPAPTAESAPVRSTAPVALLQGTNDPVLLARAFLQAGKYQQAVQRLEPLAAAADTPLLPLFYLALAYEKLGDIDRADSVFLRIEAKDTVRQTDGSSVFGRWANAARNARQHMTWMRDHAQPPPPAKASAEPLR